jgi:hypothetical protein
MSQHHKLNRAGAGRKGNERKTMSKRPLRPRPVLDPPTVPSADEFASRRADTFDREEQEREFMLRLLQAFIDQFDRMKAAVGGRNIRFDIPLAEQLDPETLQALAAAMNDDDELQNYFAALDRMGAADA